ncbi:MAG: tetratricopeptide repeat-containing sensor histidine kinase [Chitinophagaceae bacterium]
MTQKPFLFKNTYISFVLGSVIALSLGCGRLLENKEQPSSTNIDSIFSQTSNIALYDKVNTEAYFINHTKNLRLKFDEEFKRICYLVYINLYYTERYDKSDYYADSLLRLINNNETTASKWQIAKAYLSKGDALYFLEKYSEAYAFFYKAQKIGLTELDDCTLGDYNYRIGMLLYKQGRFLQAATNFKQSITQGKKCNYNFENYFRIQENYSNAGLSYYKAEKYDSALYFYKEGLNFIDANKGTYLQKAGYNNIAKGVIYGNLAQVFVVQKQYDTAINLLRKSIEIMSSIEGDKLDAQYSNMKLANIFFLQNSYDSCLNVLERTKTGLDSLPNPRALLEYYRLSWKLNEAKNLSANAYSFLNKYVSLNEELQSANKKLVAFDIGKEVAMIEAMNDRDELKRNVELNRLYFLVFITLIILVLTIATFWYSQYKKKQKNLRKLELLHEKNNEQKKQIEQAFNQLKENTKDKDRILWLVSHDLRSPITTIQSVAQLLATESDNAETREMMHLINVSAGNSLHLISEILESAGLAAQQEVAFSAVPLHELLNETISILQTKAAEKSQTIILKNRNQPHLNVLGNKLMLWRVFSNLISNSLKFSFKESSVIIDFQQNGNDIVISVQDFGIGIPDEARQKVFDMFSTAKRTGTDGEKAFGLGLSICKEIVQKHNGSIWFESTPNIGTTFYVSLPLLT